MGDNGFKIFGGDDFSWFFKIDFVIWGSLLFFVEFDYNYEVNVLFNKDCDFGWGWLKSLCFLILLSCRNNLREMWRKLGS